MVFMQTPAAPVMVSTQGVPVSGAGEPASAGGVDPKAARTVFAYVTRWEESQVPQISKSVMNAMVASVTFVVASSAERPYAGNVVSSYQMKSSWRSSVQRPSPFVDAYQVALSLEPVSHRPPTDHCAIPRPGPPPY